MSTNESSLKLKIKLPSTLNSTVQSSFSINSLASIPSNISTNSDTKSYSISEINNQPIQSTFIPATNIGKKKKEVLNYGSSIDSIMLGNDFVDEENFNKSDAVETEKKERIIMKLKTKPSSLDQTSSIPTIAATTISNETHSQAAPPPIKLKLKISNIDSTAKKVAYINPSETMNQEIPNDFLRKEDNEEDEMIHELKNSYTDGDFVYPSLKKETSLVSRKKIEPTSHGDETNNENKKSSRKRKLKPHAVQYLMPKEETSIQNEQINLGDITKKEENLEKKPKKMIDKLIEKNLKSCSASTLVVQKKQDESDAASNKYNKNEESNDVDYDDKDEEYIDDEDEDFKLKCKNNLKLSKKIKKNLIKHQKKLDEDSTSVGKQQKKPNPKCETQVSTSNASKKTSGKKGLATAKQRLGKLLKLNRIVNI